MPQRKDLPPHIINYWEELREKNSDHTMLELAEVMGQQFLEEFAGLKPQSIYAHIIRTKDRPPKGEPVLPEPISPDVRAHYDDSMPGHLYRDATIPVTALPRSITYTWDLETTNLNSFLGRLIIGSFMDMATHTMLTRTILDYLDGPQTVGNLDRAETQLVNWVVDRHDEADAMIGHNTIGFDNGFLRGRLEALQMDRRLPKRQHWDTMQIAKFGFKGRPQGASMENLADFFRLPIQKDKPSKYDWAGSITIDPGAIERIKFRCEEDVRVNALLWGKLREYLHTWRGK